jgi:hypothetical protein
VSSPVGLSIKATPVSASAPLLNEFGNSLPPVEHVDDPIDLVEPKTVLIDSDTSMKTGPQNGESELQARTPVRQTVSRLPEGCDPGKDDSPLSNGPTLDKVVQVPPMLSLGPDVDVGVQEDNKMVSPPLSPQIISRPAKFVGDSVPDEDLPMSDPSLSMSPGSSLPPLRVQGRTQGWRGANVRLGSRAIPEVRTAARPKRRFTPLVPSGRANKKHRPSGNFED